MLFAVCEFNKLPYTRTNFDAPQIYAEVSIYLLFEFVYLHFDNQIPEMVNLQSNRPI